jgi:DNA-binding NarL/FixJ family response regulator
MKINNPRIIIVDDNVSFRKTAMLFLTKELNAEIVGEASNGIEFSEIAKTVWANIILMDIRMPGIDGISATKSWCKFHPNAKVIAVTMYSEKTYLLKLIEAGFKGCIYKANFFAEIKDAISTVNSGRLYFKNMMVNI